MKILRSLIDPGASLLMIPAGAMAQTPLLPPPGAPRPLLPPPGMPTPVKKQKPKESAKPKPPAAAKKPAPAERRSPPRHLRRRRP